MGSIRYKDTCFHIHSFQNSALSTVFNRLLHSENYPEGLTVHLPFSLKLISNLPFFQCDGFSLVLFVPPRYCSSLLLLFTNLGFVLTATENQKGSSTSLKGQGQYPAPRINPSIPNRGVRTDSLLGWMHYTWGGYVLPTANNHDEGTLLCNPQAPHSKAARNITSCSLPFYFERHPKCISCFQPYFTLCLQEFILYSYPSFSFHNPSPFLKYQTIIFKLVEN